MSETIDQLKVDTAFSAAKALNQAEVGMLVALLRAFQSGREASALPSEKRSKGRPVGSRNRKVLGHGSAELQPSGAADGLVSRA